jgi:hypothetical protein
MTQTFAPQGDPNFVNTRNDFMDQADEFKSEIPYQNPEDSFSHVDADDDLASPGPPATETVFDAEPSLYFIRKLLAQSKVGGNSRPRMYIVQPGVAIPVAQHNSRRSQLIFWIDPVNTANVFLTQTQGITVAGPGAPVVGLPAASTTRLVLNDSGSWYAFCATATQILYVVEETLA